MIQRIQLPQEDGRIQLLREDEVELELVEPKGSEAPVQEILRHIWAHRNRTPRPTLEMNQMQNLGESAPPLCLRRVPARTQTLRRPPVRGQRLNLAQQGQLQLLLQPKHLLSRLSTNEQLAPINLLQALVQVVQDSPSPARRQSSPQRRQASQNPAGAGGPGVPAGAGSQQEPKGPI